VTFTFVMRCTHQRRLQRPHGGIFRPRLEMLEDRRCLSGSHLLVADFGGDQVLRFDGTAGEFVDTFVPKHSGGLNQPYGVLFGPDGNGDGRPDLYVSTGENSGPGQIKEVLRYDGATGAFLDTFTQGGEMKSPTGIIFSPDGDLYVATGTGGFGGRIARYDGISGAFLGDFVPPGSGGLRAPSGIVFGPSGRNPNRPDLYVSSRETHNILRYDGTTGDFLEEFVARGSGGLDTPQGLTFGPDGNLYVASSAILMNNARAVLRFQGPAGPTPGAFLDTFVLAASGGLRTPWGLIFGPDGNHDGQFDLYVTNSELEGGSHKGKNGAVLRYDGLTGDFIDTFVAARSGRLDDPQFLTFTQTDPVTLAYTPTAATTSVAAAPAASGFDALLFAFDVITARDDGHLATGGEVRIAPVQQSRVALFLPPEPLASSTVARHPAAASLLSDDNADEVYGDADSDLLIDGDLLALIALIPNL